MAQCLREPGASAEEAVIGALARSGRAGPRAGVGAVVPAVALLLVAAAAARLPLLDSVPFTYDDATVATAVRGMLETRRLLTDGMQSSGGPLNPPLFDYLMALPLAATRNPRAAILFTECCNVAGVLAAFAFARRAWGTRAALIGAGLFAVAPWAAVYSRGIWAPDLEPPLAALCLYALLRAFQDDTRWLGAALTIWLAMGQLHPDAILLAPAILLAFLLLRPPLRRDWPVLVAGAVVGLLPLVPYVVNDAGQHWDNARKFLIAASHPYQFDLWSVQLAVMNVTSLGTAQLAGTPYRQFTTWGPLFGALAEFASALLAGAALVAAGDILRLGRRPPLTARGFALLLTVAWFAAPVLLTLRRDQPLYQHYLLILFPAPFLMLGYAADRAGWGAGKRWGGARLQRGRAIAVALAVAVFAAYDVALLGSFYGHLAALARRPNPDLALGTLEHVAALAPVTPSGGPLDGVFPDKGVRVPVAYLLDVAAPTLDAPADALVLPPAGQAHRYLFDDRSRPAAQALLAAGIPVTGVVPYLDAQHTAIGFRWPAGVAPDRITAALRPLPVRLANGVQFLAYGVSRPDAATLRVEYVWRVTRVDPALVTSNPALYTHLLAGADRMVAQHDGMPIEAARWQAGETIAAWFDLPIATVPPGRYNLRFGMYSRPAITRVAALDANGRPGESDFALTSVTLPGN